MKFLHVLRSGACCGVLSFAVSIVAQSPAPNSLKAQIDAQMPELTATYKQLHQHPELSHHEEKTSALLAGELEKAGYAVTRRIGTYPDGSKA